MILLGAGSSVPFGIPAMRSFIHQFREEKLHPQHELLALFGDIENSFKQSESLIGYNVDFDLESLIVVLEDIASTSNRSLSLPTFAFMLYSISKTEKERYYKDSFYLGNLKAIHGKCALEMLQLLRLFIFNKCIEPMKIGQTISDSYDFLDYFYGPLFYLIEPNIFDHKKETWVFSTNWDLCLKQWFEYLEIPIEDGTSQSRQKKTVLLPSVGWTKSKDSVKVVSLHGGFDLIQSKRFVLKKQFNEIEKVSNPEIYFDGKPEEISKAFIIYPLEAVGYEQTVKSPYLDMLVQLRDRLRVENTVFSIGFSFRDAVIASIFEEAVRERLEKKQAEQLKVLVISSSPEQIVTDLKSRGYVNLANVVLTVKCKYPIVTNYKRDKIEIQTATQSMVNTIVEKMKQNLINFDLDLTNKRLEKYDLKIQKK